MEQRGTYTPCRLVSPVDFAEAPGSAMSQPMQYHRDLFSPMELACNMRTGGVGRGRRALFLGVLGPHCLVMVI